MTVDEARPHHGIQAAHAATPGEQVVLLSRFLLLNVGALPSLADAEISPCAVTVFKGDS